jgi:hypothetical protein
VKDARFSSKLLTDLRVEVDSSNSQISVYPSLHGYHTRWLAMSCHVMSCHVNWPVVVRSTLSLILLSQKGRNVIFTSDPVSLEQWLPLIFENEEYF